MSGNLFVIDGTDGAGKGTQAELLKERLISLGRVVNVADFPQYGKPSAGMVENYLNGKYGTDANDVPPKIASMFYALDRYDGSFEMREQLKIGDIVSNRYATANAGHQGAKFEDPQELEEFLKWLDYTEYEFLGIPRPTLNIILHVPAHIGQKLVDEKGERGYTNKTRDIHEADLNHLKAAERTYLKIAQLNPDMFKLVSCAPNDTMRSREDIHEEIFSLVKPYLK